MNDAMRWLGHLRHQGGALLLTDMPGFSAWGGEETVINPPLQLAFHGPLVASLPARFLPRGPGEWHQQLPAASAREAHELLEALLAAAVTIDPLSVLAVPEKGRGLGKLREMSATDALPDDGWFRFELLDGAQPLLQLTIQGSRHKPGTPWVELEARGSLLPSLPKKLLRQETASDTVTVQLECLEAAAELVDNLSRVLRDTPHARAAMMPGRQDIDALFEQANRAGGAPLDPTHTGFAVLWSTQSKLTMILERATEARTATQVLGFHTAKRLTLQNHAQALLWNTGGGNDDDVVSVGLRQTADAWELVLASIEAEDEEEARSHIAGAAGTPLFELSLAAPAVVCFAVHESKATIQMPEETTGPARPLPGTDDDSGWWIPLSAGTYAVTVGNGVSDRWLASWCRLERVR